MLYDQKMTDLYERIKKKGSATVVELCESLHQSESTIRRNLTKLSDAKLIRRFHGGAILSTNYAPEPPIYKRAQLFAEEKDLIAEEAARLVEDGDTIVLQSGTTVGAMYKYLADKQNLRIITNSFLLPQEFLSRPNWTVIIMGGELDSKEMCTRGYLTTLSMNRLRANKLFMGVRGIHPVYGVMADDLREIETVRSFTEASEEVVVLADHSKFECISPVIQCATSEIDILITDDQAPKDLLKDFSEKGIDVRTVAHTIPQ